MVSCLYVQIRPPKVSNECTWEVLSRLADYFVGNSNLTVFFGGISTMICVKITFFMIYVIYMI